MIYNSNMKTARKAVKLSQAEVANRLGVTQSSISLWECGETSPGVDNFLKLCEMYQMTPNQLLGFDDETESNAERKVAAPFICYSNNEKEPLSANEELYLIQCLAKARRGQVNQTEIDRILSS